MTHPSPFTKLLIGATLIATAGTVEARQLTPTEALDRATQEIAAPTASPTGNGPLRALAAQPLHCVITRQVQVDQTEIPALYVFNAGDNAGYIVTPADDRFRAVLGVADSGAIDPNDMPPSLEWWLGQYAQEIEYYMNQESTLLTFPSNMAPRTSVAAPKTSNYSSWSAIAPMVSTLWDQTSPYNNKCPIDKTTNKRSVTGCVATAMAQIMNYHKWPEQGTGSNSYSSSNCGTLSMDFSTTTFDWANMLNKYSSSSSTTQKNAVATLMLACGISTNMSYTSDASGTQSGLASLALRKYFKYSDKSVFYGRPGFTTEQWEQLVYDALSQGYPVGYSGTGTAGGHAFVCDGYSKNGLFHFNWGWSGSSDGYFALDALNPGSLGTGGGAGGFNTNQDIYVAVRPDQSGFTPSFSVPQNKLYCQYYSTNGSTTNPSIVFDLWNNSDDELRFYVGIKIVDSADKEVYTQKNIMSGTSSLGIGYGYNRMTMTPGASFFKSYGDGTFRVYITYCQTGSSTYYAVPAETGGDHFEYVVSNGSITSFKVADGSSTPPATGSANLVFGDVKCDNPMYIGQSNTITITLSNTGDGAYQGEPAFALVQDGSVIWGTYLSEGTENIPAGSSSTYTVTTTFKNVDPGTYYAYLCEASGEYLQALDVLNTPIVLNKGSEGQAKLKVSKLECDNPMYIGQSNTISLTLDNQGDGNYEGEPILALAMDDGSAWATYISEANVTIASGSSKTFTLTESFEDDDMEPGEYPVYLCELDPDSDLLTILDDTGLTVTLANPSSDVEVTGLEATPEQTVLHAGETTRIIVAVEPDNATDKTVTFTSNSKSLKVDANGKVTVVDRPELGTATVTVKANGGNATATVEFEIEATPVTKVTVSAPATSITAGETMQLTANVTPELATDATVTWSVDYTGATISQQGLLAVDKEALAGTLTVTATANDGSNVTGTLNITVIPASNVVEVEAIDAAADKTELKAGERAVITATVTPANATDKSVTFTTNSKSLTVDANGNVTVVDHPELGKATVTVKANGGNATATVEFEIVATPVASINVTAAETSVEAGNSLQFSASVAPALATDATVTWSVDYPGATISQKGLLTVDENAQPGTLTVTATANDGSGVSGTMTVTVTANSGIDAVEANGLSVTTDNRAVTVKGVAHGLTVELFDITGRAVARATSTGAPIQLRVATSGIYILRAAGQSIRLNL